MNKFKDSIEGFANIIGNIEERWDFLYEEIKRIELRQFDLLHEIENDKFDVVKGYKKLMELKDTRRYRRKLKNEQKMIEPLFNYIRTHKNISIDLFKVKKETDKITQQQDNWIYRKRIEDKKVV
jgi:Txe/YoeB family toxin of Txe-Axe toxin-antitoxin module